MSIKSKTSTYSVVIVVLVALAQIPSTRATGIVAPGSDLLQTDPGVTSFFGYPFEGVPLGTYDFNAAIGVKDVGPTDIIVRRVAEASVPGPGHSATVPTVVDAFQVRSVGEVSILGGPLGTYYVTLASRRGGPVSTGTMTINFGTEGDPHGTFSSSFDLYVDVRLGSLTGPILDSRLISIPDSGASPWRHEPTGPISIPGVNVDLNGNDSGSDFWIVGSVSKDTPNGRIGAHNAGATVPDLGNSLLLLGLGLIGIGWRIPSAWRASAGAS